MMQNITVSSGIPQTRRWRLATRHPHCTSRWSPHCWRTRTSSSRGPYALWQACCRANSETPWTHCERPSLLEDRFSTVVRRCRSLEWGSWWRSKIRIACRRFFCTGLFSRSFPSRAGAPLRPLLRESWHARNALDCRCWFWWLRLLSPSTWRLSWCSLPQGCWGLPSVPQTDFLVHLPLCFPYSFHPCLNNKQTTCPLGGQLLHLSYFIQLFGLRQNPLVIKCIYCLLNVPLRSLKQVGGLLLGTASQCHEIGHLGFAGRLLQLKIAYHLDTILKVFIINKRALVKSNFLFSMRFTEVLLDENLIKLVLYFC